MAAASAGNYEKKFQTVFMVNNSTNYINRRNNYTSHLKSLNTQNKSWCGYGVENPVL
jgi:hypothetical protein